DVTCSANGIAVQTVASACADAVLEPSCSNKRLPRECPPALERGAPYHMNPTSRTTWLLSLVGAAAIGVAATWLVAIRSRQPPPPVAPMISLEKMGHLASVKVNYADVIEFTENRTQDIPWTQWELHFGGTKVLLVARGDCTVATD